MKMKILWYMFTIIHRQCNCTLGALEVDITQSSPESTLNSDSKQTDFQESLVLHTQHFWAQGSVRTQSCAMCFGMTFLEQGGWTRWTTVTPSNLTDSVILWAVEFWISWGFSWLLQTALQKFWGWWGCCRYSRYVLLNKLIYLFFSIKINF